MHPTPFIHAAVSAANMSTSPGYYSGRGATISDLEYKHLKSISDAIQKNAGDRAQKSFVQMVRDMPRLSASEFLETLYALEAAGWQWNKSLIPKNGGIPNDRENPITMLFGIIDKQFGTQRDDTAQIRHQFLAENNVPVPDLYDLHRRMVHERASCNTNQQPKRRRK